MQDSSGIPLPVAPLGFRSNDLFLGFQIELHQIYTKLHGSKRRTSCPSAVLVWGPAGCGKTHLVREYLWRYRPEYPGGTFWVDSRTEETCRRGFWDIGQTADLLDKGRYPGKTWETDVPFIDSVRKWFELRDDWLLIFDGVAFDSDEDLENFMRYIPNSTDRRGNGIIFTSHDKTLAKRQRLLSPSAVKIHPLSMEDARDFLFHSLDIRSPNSIQFDRATELVKRYECLPLAIHAAAHALIAQGRSLEKYSPGSSSKKLAEPYLEILNALRDKTRFEAINLLRLLMFFNHNVPVALLMLGRRVLIRQGIEIRAIDREGSSKRELDNTIAVLIRYGLVERTLQRYQLNTSLSPEESFSSLSVTEHSSILDLQKVTLQTQMLAEEAGTDAQPDNDLADPPPKRPESSQASSSARSVSCSIDILRIHTVLQEVLRDELRLNESTEYEYWQWLSLASKVLCQSYVNAHDRIKKEGLIRDYREYETQAARLWSHFPKKPVRNDIPCSSIPVFLLTGQLESNYQEIETGSP